MTPREDRSDAGDGRPETRLQRLDRNLEELTGELRVVVTGVQVLFAFLLVVPFDSGFDGVRSSAVSISRRSSARRSPRSA
jgi:hypothetical protein